MTNIMHNSSVKNTLEESERNLHFHGIHTLSINLITEPHLHENTTRLVCVHILVVLAAFYAIWLRYLSMESSRSDISLSTVIGSLMFKF